MKWKGIDECAWSGPELLDMYKMSWNNECMKIDEYASMHEYAQEWAGIDGYAWNGRELMITESLCFYQVTSL